MIWAKPMCQCVLKRWKVRVTLSGVRVVEWVAVSRAYYVWPIPMAIFAVYFRDFRRECGCHFSFPKKATAAARKTTSASKPKNNSAAPAPPPCPKCKAANIIKRLWLVLRLFNARSGENSGSGASATLRSGSTRQSGNEGSSCGDS